MADFITAYGPKNRDSTIVCPPGRTEQAAAAECDINNIMARFTKGKTIDHLAKYEQQYGEQSSVSLHEALNVVTGAQRMFLELPAKTRERFKNDPGEFLDFVQDEKNHQEMYDLGLSKDQPLPEIPAPEAPEEPIAPEEPPVAP